MIAVIASVVLAFGPAPADLQVIVNPDGSSELYQCEEDSPPPCVWNCERRGNHLCGPA